MALIRFNQLRGLRRTHRRKKIVMTGGVFDILHGDHLRHFQRVQRYGQIVVVAISCDGRVRERKGPGRPINSAAERARLVDALRGIDYVLVTPRPSHTCPIPTLKVIRELHPDVFVASDQRWLKSSDEFRQLGIQLILVPEGLRCSTTKIIHRILKNTRYQCQIGGCQH